MRFSFGNDSGVDKTLKQAEKYVQQGKYSAAVDEYRKLLDSAPGDVTLLNTIGDLCVRANRDEEAVRYFQRVADIYESSGAVQSAIAVYKKIVKTGRESTEVSLKLADLLCRQGLMPEARRQYAAAADACRRAGDSARALKIQQKIADIDPENFECRLDLADQYRAAGYPREAYQAYLQAGQEMQRKGRYADGVPVFKKALDVRPESKVALGGVVDCLVHQGALGEALSTLEGMIAAAPDDPDLVSMLGKVQLSSGMLDRAESTFARLAEIDPARPDALLEVARHHIAAGHDDRAMAIVDRIADALIARGLKKKATAVLKEILRRDPSNVAVLKRLADIYTRVGEKRNLTATLNTLIEAATRRGLRDEATAALQRMMEVDPDAVVEVSAAAVSGSDASTVSSSAAFPEGFESGPALMDSMRGAPSRPAAAVPVSRAGGRLEEIIPDRFESDEYETPVQTDVETSMTAASEYSMELADELVAKHPEFRQARIKLLEDLVASQPKYVVGRVKLKNLLRESGERDRAAEQCLELARIHEELGDRQQAKAFVAEAYELQPSVDALSARAAGAAGAAPPQPEDLVKLDEMFTLKEFNKYFDREWRRAIRDGKALSLVKIEVDALNDYYDTYGLLSGDYCLERIAATLETELLRPGDLVSNCGGGDFLALLPDTPHDAVAVVAERLRARVEGLRLQHEGAPTGGVVTISVGAAAAIAHASYSSDALIRAADDALLSARLDGGNRVVSAPLVTI